MYFLIFYIVNTHNIISSYSALKSTTTQPRQLKKGSHIKPVGTNMAQHQDNLFQYTRKQSQSFFFSCRRSRRSSSKQIFRWWWWWCWPRVELTFFFLLLPQQLLFSFHVCSFSSKSTIVFLPLLLVVPYNSRLCKKAVLPTPWK